MMKQELERTRQQKATLQKEIEELKNKDHKEKKFLSKGTCGRYISCGLILGGSMHAVTDSCQGQ